GPIFGAVLMVLAFVLFSEFTKAWLLYLCLIFLFMVMYAPGGIASLIMMYLRVAMFGKLRSRLLPYLGLALTGLMMLAGAGAMIEMMYHLQLSTSQGAELVFLGTQLNAQSLQTWPGSAVLMLVGLGLFELVRRKFAKQWGAIQEHIEAEIQRKAQA
ncbi:MAG: branched-chain amino acid ABC transporter permease, partial [Burkholderiales bacterium PBB4]